MEAFYLNSLDIASFTQQYSKLFNLILNESVPVVINKFNTELLEYQTVTFYKSKAKGRTSRDDVEYLYAIYTLPDNKIKVHSISRARNRIQLKGYEIDKLTLTTPTPLKARRAGGKSK